LPLAGGTVTGDVDFTGKFSLDSAQVTSTAAELNKLDGVSANVTAANLNTLTAGSSSDADALHTHDGKAGTSHTYAGADKYLEYVSSGTGTLLEITASGTESCGIEVIASGSNTNCRGIKITASNNAKGLEVVSSDNKSAIKASGASAGDPIVEVNNNGVGISLAAANQSTGVCASLQNSGNGPHLNFNGDPTVASPADGDLWFDGTNLKLRVGSTTYNIDKTSV